MLRVYSKSRVLGKGKWLEEGAGVFYFVWGLGGEGTQTTALSLCKNWPKFSNFYIQ